MSGVIYCNNAGYQAFKKNQQKLGIDSSVKENIYTPAKKVVESLEDLQGIGPIIAKRITDKGYELSDVIKNPRLVLEDCRICNNSIDYIIETNKILKEKSF